MSYYDARKAGGVTESDLRFSTGEIKQHYKIQDADLVFVSQNSLFGRRDILKTIKKGGKLIVGQPLLLD